MYVCFRGWSEGVKHTSQIPAGQHDSCERGCPSPGPRDMRLMLHSSYTHMYTPFSSVPSDRFGNTSFCRKKLCRSFLLQRDTVRIGTGAEGQLTFPDQKGLERLGWACRIGQGLRSNQLTTPGPEKTGDKSHFLQPTFAGSKSQLPPP